MIFDQSFTGHPEIDCNQPRLRNGVGIICAALGLWAALYVGAF